MVSCDIRRVIEISDKINVKNTQEIGLFMGAMHSH